jgi:hypothetical protein
MKLDKTLSFYDEVVLNSDEMENKIELLTSQLEEKNKQIIQIEIVYKEKIIFKEKTIENLVVEYEEIGRELENKLKENDTLQVRSSKTTFY